MTEPTKLLEPGARVKPSAEALERGIFPIFRGVKPRDWRGTVIEDLGSERVRVRWDVPVNIEPYGYMVARRFVETVGDSAHEN